MPKRSLLFASLLTMGLCYGSFVTAGPATTQSSPTAYRVREHGFAMTASAEWQQVNYKKFALMLRRKVPQAKGALPQDLVVGVVADKQPIKPELLDAIVDRARAELADDPAAEVDAKEETKIGGNRAIGYGYRLPILETAASHYRVITINRGKAYMLEFACVPDEFEEALPHARAVIDSFEWLSD